MAQRILVADDDREIVRLVEAYLRQSGLGVLRAYDGKEALWMARREKPDLVILDLMMPEMDGMDVCRALRRESDIPIIMLTARVEEADRLIGLELGADDYIVKPFSPREVVARVRTVLRRAQGEPIRAQRLVAGPVAMDRERREVSVGGRRVDLTRTEFDLLAVLMENPGHAFTRLQLLDRIQGQAFEGYERTIDVHIKNLRRKIEGNPGEPRFLLTVRGVGYKFAEDVDAR